MPTEDIFSIFDNYGKLDQVEVDKAIRNLHRELRNVQRTEAWPVGSIFISVTTEDPTDLFGYGEWVRFGEGRVLISVDGNNFNAAERTG